MKKLFLGFTALSVFALASCAGSPTSSSDYKKCNYLSVAGSVYVNEFGSKKDYKMVSTYIFDDETLANLTDNWFYNFPSSIAIMEDYSVPANGQVNVIPPKPKASIEFYAVTNLDGVQQFNSYTMYLVEDSTTVYETTYEYYYSESNKSVKEVTHKDVAVPGSSYSYQAAYDVSDGPFYLTSESITYPTTEYNLSTPLFDIEEETFERYTDVGIYPVTYSFVAE